MTAAFFVVSVVGVIAGLVITALAVGIWLERRAASRRREPVVMIALVPRATGIPTAYRREHPNAPHWN